MGADFEWYDKYSIGVEEIDGQHQRFLELINRTYELGNKTIGHEEVSKLLDELENYAIFHFNREELLMQTYLYPKYMDQKNQHDKISKKLEIEVQAVKAHKEDLSKLLYYLIHWFVDHDNEYDKEFGEYVNKIRSV